MAIALVQEKGNAGNSDPNNTTFDSSVTSGNLIVVCVRDSIGGQTATVTDNQSNSYTLAKSFGGGGSSFIYYAENVTGGTVTVTVDATGDFATRMTIHEFSGIKIVGSLDASTNSAEGSDVTGPITPSVDNALLFAMLGTVSDVTGTGAGSGWTLSGVNGASRIWSGYRIETTAASHEASFSYTGTSDRGAAIVAFHAAPVISTMNNIGSTVLSSGSGNPKIWNPGTWGGYGHGVVSMVTTLNATGSGALTGGGVNWSLIHELLYPYDGSANRRLFVYISDGPPSGSLSFNTNNDYYQVVIADELVGCTGQWGTVASASQQGYTVTSPDLGVIDTLPGDIAFIAVGNAAETATTAGANTTLLDSQGPIGQDTFLRQLVTGFSKTSSTPSLGGQGGFNSGLISVVFKGTPPYTGNRAKIKGSTNQMTIRPQQIGNKITFRS